MNALYSEIGYRRCDASDEEPAGPSFFTNIPNEHSLFRELSHTDEKGKPLTAVRVWKTRKS